MDSFLTSKPKGFSWREIERIGKAIKAGSDFDQDKLDAFLTHHTHLCACLSSVLQETLDCLLLPVVNSPEATIRPGTKGYQLSARVKTLPTLTEKLKRMSGTPLNRIVDVSGVRLDIDVTLKDQLRLAELFQSTFEEIGAKKAEIKDFREKPHRGYRAIHLHLKFDAGSAEFQLRTAFQSRWSNTYEEVADILGREIRYEEHVDDLTPQTTEIVHALLELSERSYTLEKEFETKTSEVIPDAIRQIDSGYELLWSTLTHLRPNL